MDGIFGTHNGIGFFSLTEGTEVIVDSICDGVSADKYVIICALIGVVESWY